MTASTRSTLREHGRLGSAGAPARSRLRVALLADYMNIFSDGYEERIRQAFDRECRRVGVDLLLAYGRSVETGEPENSSHNTVFEQIGLSSVDAVVVLSGALSAGCGAAGISRFLERYRSVPLCSVGMAVAGVSSVLVDGARGMRAMVEHLVAAHGCARLAFVGGPPNAVEAGERFAAYRAVLEERGLPFDPARVVCGYFTRSGGAAAAEELLVRGVALDGIVASNDSMALGVLDVLRRWVERGAAPLPVSGFDDLGEARWADPPLSTVAQPFAEIARASIDAVLRQIDGRETPHVTVLAPKLLIRQSCRCGSDAGRVVRREGASSTPSRPDAALARSTPAVGARSGEPLERLTDLQACIESSLDAACADPSGMAVRLVDALRQEIAGEAGAMCRVLNAELRGRDAHLAQVVQQLLSRLRSELRAQSTPALEDMWHRARDLAAKAASVSFVQARLDLHFLHVKLLALSERLSSSSDANSLREALLERLPDLGINTAFLVRFVGPDNRELVPVMCMLDGEPWDLCRRAYPASELMPPGGFAASTRRTIIVFPLVHDSQPQGFVGFEYSPDVVGHRLIREQVSAAMRVVLLNQAIVERTLLHDMSIQDSLAAARRLQSLSVVAGGVAHDLNNALGPLLALPDAILADIERLPLDAERSAEFRADALAIKSGAQRAAQTVRDLLTLGRPTRASRHVLDVCTLVKTWCGQGLEEDRAGGPNQVRVSLKLVAEPLTIRAAETQLGRALGNLVRHATQESVDGSLVEVEVSAVALAKPLEGYERIAPGDYAVIAVSDRGPGVPEEELARLFEPYFSRRRAASEHGMGLGLAMVHAVVKDHAGYIDVVSQGGLGTTFRIYLPIVGESAALVKPRAQRAKISARLLVVDDEPLQLRTARRVLELLGYRVDVLNSGRKAIEVFERASEVGTSPYPLVLMDMTLNEEKDGLEVLEDIRRLFPAQRAIVLSGHAPTDLSRGAGDGGMVWLAKPYTMDALAQAVAAVLGNDGSGAP